MEEEAKETNECKVSSKLKDDKVVSHIQGSKVGAYLSTVVDCKRRSTQNIRVLWTSFLENEGNIQ